MIKGIFFDVEFDDYINDEKFISPGEQLEKAWNDINNGVNPGSIDD